MISNEEIVNKYSHLLDHAEDMHLVLSFLDSAIKAGLTAPILEVGNNMGGSALCFLEVLKRNNAKNWLYTVDPYGNIPYHNGGFKVDKSVYGNEIYRLASKEIANFCFDNQLNHYHFKSTSLDFIEKYISIFMNHDDGNSSSLDKFSFIFLDGSHDPEVVLEEFKYFIYKVEVGGSIIVDDTQVVGRRLQSFIDETQDIRQLFKTTHHHQRFLVEKIAL